MRTGTKIGFGALAVVLLGGAAFMRFIVYPEHATLDFAAGTGPNRRCRRRTRP